MKRSFTSSLLIILMGFEAISGILGGVGLVFSPSGEALGLPLEMLKDSPFSDFLIPGLFLLFFLGILPIVILYGLIKKSKCALAEKLNLYKNQHWSWTFSYYIGLILLLWINFELLFGIQYVTLHFIYTILGLLFIFITLVPSTKNDYKIKL